MQVVVRMFPIRDFNEASSHVLTVQISNASKHTGKGFFTHTNRQKTIMSESETIRFIQVWMIVYACLAYTYKVGKIVPPGKVRSLLILPVVALFFLLPLRLTSFILCGLTALFVTWLGSFKLALFSFGKGPLATDYPSITFSRFLAVGSLPIILSTKSEVTEKSTLEFNGPSMVGWGFALKSVLFALIHKMFRFEGQLHPFIIFYMHGTCIYITLEFITYGIRAVVGPLLGLELDLPFNEPLFSTSVQNFWGRRWNVAMGGILRASIYDPVRAVLTPYIGRKHAQQLSVLATFGTSGIMHEIIFYYLSRKQPTWNMTWYFLLHGLTVVVETDVKRLIGKKWRLPTLVSVLLTVSFNTVLGIVVFSPIFDHCYGHVRAAEEFPPFVTFLKSLRRSLMLSSFKGV